MVNAALVPAAKPGETVAMQYGGLMSVVAGFLGDEQTAAAHIQSGLEVQKLASTYTVRVPARTLTSILDEVAPGREIDLLSLDVEGMEALVLRGLDFGRYAPRYLCIEVRNREVVEAVLGARYRPAEVLADHGIRQDLLYQRK